MLIPWQGKRSLLTHWSDTAKNLAAEPGKPCHQGMSLQQDDPDLPKASLEDLARFHRDGARRALMTALGLLLASFFALRQLGLSAIGLLLPSLALISLLQALRDWRRSTRCTPEQLLDFRRMIRLDEVLHSHPLLHTKILSTGLLLMFLVQWHAGIPQAVEVGGLIKPLVREGEWWRLLACALLHANLLHLLINLTSLFALGRMLETLGTADDLPIVFSLSIFTGSLASLSLLPNTTSVGASGGILGLAGYLLVLAFKRRKELPATFRRLLWNGVALTALAGTLGYHYVDNAAHAGGLLGGVLAGLLLVPKRPAPENQPSGIVKTMAAWACLGWFAGAAFFCLRVLLHF